MFQTLPVKLTDEKATIDQVACTISSHPLKRQRRIVTSKVAWLHMSFSKKSCDLRTALIFGDYRWNNLLTF